MLQTVEPTSTKWRYVGAGKARKKRGLYSGILINIQQEYEDAKVAALLCRGGVVRYKVKDGVADAFTHAWLCENAVPNIHHRYPDNHRVCRVLGIALLYI